MDTILKSVEIEEKEMVNSREYRNEANSHEIRITSILLFFFFRQNQNLRGEKD